MSFKEILCRFNVLYFFILLALCISESNQLVKISLDPAPKSDNAALSLPDVIINTSVPHHQNKTRRSNGILQEDGDSYIFIQKIIAQEIIPLLFGRYPTSELTFKIQNQAANYSICGMNRIWKIVLKFDQEADEGPNAATFEEILDNIFATYQNMSKIEYIFDFTQKKTNREIINVFFCFNKTTDPDTTPEDLVRGIIDTEIIPIADGFKPERKPETKISRKDEMHLGECSSDVFEVNVTDVDGGICFSTMRTELLLLSLMEKYPKLTAACVPFDEGFVYNNTLKLCMKVAKQPKTCTMRKDNVEMDCCGWKDDTSAVVPPGGWPPLQNGSMPFIIGGAPPAERQQKTYPKGLKEKWMPELSKLKSNLIEKKV